MAVGKLNYTNRKHVGGKLGAIVEKDLRKKAETARKKANDTVDTQPMELCLRGKKLGDEGLQLVVAGLLDALGSTPTKTRPPFLLEELNLSDNDLTAKSLRVLAPIITLAARHLKDLDLSENLIEIPTKEEADHLRVFLTAFQFCWGMRRLVLSKNNFAGPKFMEIFAQVYSQNAEVEPSTPGNSTNASPLPSPASALPSNDAPNRRKRETSVLSTASSQVPSEMMRGTILKRRIGLRSIPYIILQDTRLDDSGVLWFSSILQIHCMPDDLMVTKAKPGPMQTTLASYKPDTACDGIVYKPNDSITTTGWKLIDASEAARQELCDGSGLGEIREFEEAKPRNSVSTDDYVIVKSSGPYDTRSIGSSPSRRYAHIQDLESLTKKLQRCLIDGKWFKEVEIWMVALKAVSLSRILLWKIPTAAKGTQNGTKTNGINIANGNDTWNRKVLASVGPDTSVNRMVEDFRALLTLYGGQSVPAALLRMMIICPYLKKEPWRTVWVHWFQSRGEYFVQGNPRNLPTDILKTIVRHAADPETILKSQQVEQAMSFGSRPETLLEERDVQAKGESHQIWRLLDASGCLEYKITP